MTNIPNKIEEIRWALEVYESDFAIDADLVDLAPDMARIVLAAERLAKECHYLAGAHTLGEYDPPQVYLDKETVSTILRALAAYRKAVEGGE